MVLNGVRGPNRRSTIWAITSYFDPFNRGHRLPLYREFRRRLTVPLVTVELAFRGDFHLRPGDAEVLIGLRGGSVLWQKERLLNVALDALPPHVQAVVWLDCDVIFLRPDWPQAVLRELEKVALLQPFRFLHYLDRYERPGSARLSSDHAVDAVAYRFVAGTLPDQVYRRSGLSRLLRYAPGMAWAARREVVQAHKLYDAEVLGPADKLMLVAAAGRGDHAMPWMSEAHARHYMKWAGPFGEAVGRNMSYIDGDLLHLWHGDLDGRRYAERMVGFREFGFDPATDLALSERGVWRWNTDKPEMQAFVAQQLSMISPPWLAMPERIDRVDERPRAACLTS